MDLRPLCAACLGAAAGALATYLVTRRRRPEATIDHVVVRCSNGSGRLLEDALRFYRLLGFEPDRLDQYRTQQANDLAGKERKEIVFPSMRVNETTLIDLFPHELEPMFCKDSHGQVDHFCICYESAQRHLQVLEALSGAGVPLAKFGRSYGARGTGFSTYLHDPSGLYLELRNYDTDRWPEVEAKAKAMGAQPMAFPRPVQP